MNYRNKWNLSLTFICCLMIPVLSACSGGSDGDQTQTGTGSPLSLPRVINIGGANVDIASNTAQATSLAIQPAAFDNAGTDFSTDPVEAYNFNESSFGLDFVNNLLCYIDEFSATSKVNQGLFKVSVPQNLCVPEVIDPVTLDFYVNSYREDNSSPHIIQLWVEYPDYNNPDKKGRAVAEFVIHEGVSSDVPYGVFDFYDFEYTDISETAIPDWQLDSDINIRILKDSANLPRLELALSSTYTDMVSGTQSTDELYNIMQGTSADFVNGKGRVKSLSTDADFSYAYETGSVFDENNLNQVRRTEGIVDSMLCKSRKDTFAEVWSYNLYDADTGQRVEAQTSPLLFDYTHDAANDRNNKNPDDPASNHNILYQLSYYGPGSLYGFGFNTETYIPDVNLEDGTLLENLTGSYVTKAVGIGYLPKPVNSTDCDTLDVSTIFEDTDLDVDALPAIQAPSNSIDNWPNL
jgi:hypothetical protein